MAHCIPCVNIKHVTYIENCYPSLKEGGTVPRSSELSYLTFYASTRPAKLTKVGIYLQKKVERDIRKGRKSHNLVSLHIIKALIQTCHRDLNIFSKHIVKILSMLIDTRNLEIIDLTCDTFIVFCSYHDGSTLGVDLSFTTEYESLLTKFAGFCNYTNEDYKMRYIGHRAIQAAVTSSALQSSDFKTQVNILFPPLIITLAASKKKSMLESSDYMRDPVAGKQEIDLDVIVSLASQTIAALFSNLTGSLVRRSLAPFFEYLDKKEKWGDSELAVNIMKIALESVQPHYRYLFVSDILFQLENTQENSDKHVTLILILESILNAKIPLAGISVQEVLNTLFTLLVKQSTKEKIRQDLIKSIGGLSSQIYYDNQLNDIISYLVSKLRANTALDYVDHMLIHDYRVLVIHCLESIIEGSSKLLKLTDSGCRISLNVWNPALGLLKDENPHTRLMFGKSLYNFLQNTPTTLESHDGYPKHTLTDHRDLIFMDQLVHAFHDWVLITDFNVTDLKLLYSLLCLLTCRFGVDATVITVPLVFRIQQLIQENVITMTTRQLAIKSTLIDWLIVVAEFYDINSLLTYAKTLKVPTVGLNLTESLDIQTINELELFSTYVDDDKPNKVWIDKSVVVECLSNDLRDESDTHGLDLEAKLFAEWGYDAKLRNDQINRMKTVQEINETKPRLASPWEIERLPISGEEKKSNIRVANLKEALVGQLAADEDDADTSSSQSNSLPTIKKPFPMKPNDVNALLNELNSSPHSTVSLVKPPY